MRHGTTNRRSRGRNNNNNRGKGGNNRTQVFDSNGPEVRIRGTAHQIFEKYEALAKDATSIGDTVMAESYSQHAEHYQRIISTQNEQSAARVQQNRQNDTQANTKAPQADGNTQKPAAQKTAQNDDLSLPGSILGDKVKVESKGVRASETVLEDA